MICPEFADPKYLFFAEGVPPLLYYSHIPTMVVSLLIGFFVYIKNRHSLLSKILLGISVTFAFWILLSLITWTNNISSVILFTWSSFGILYTLLSVLSLYFTYVFIDQKDISFNKKIILGLLFIPVILLTPTSLNLSGFDLDLCGSAGFEGIYFTNYYYAVGFLAFFWILFLAIARYRKARGEFRNQIILLTVGIELFLLSFFTAGFFASFLVEKGIIDDFGLEQYGLFGMTIFMGFLAYLIVQYEAFNIKLLRAQALVVALFVLIGSEFFFVKTTVNLILTGITLLLIAIFGWWLVRSVKEEVKRREIIEKLNYMLEDQKMKLQIANQELKKLDKAKSEFINIASHQLRTPVGIIKGVVSILKDGTIKGFDKIKEQKFYDSAWNKCLKLENIINDILNATKADHKKYNVMDKEMEKLNVKEFFERMIGEFESETQEREIKLSLLPMEDQNIEIVGQKQYLEEAFSNLIANAIKYTPSAKKTPDVNMERDGEAYIKIEVLDKGEKILVSVSDNGIGIPAKEVPNLFQKFYRASNAVKIYNDGTGLGLFVVKEVIEGHGGKVWVESEEGKGTTFFVELPKEPKKDVDVKQKIVSDATAEV